MPKPLLVESRFDWRGGLNTVQNPDTLNINELVEATNVRLSAEHGALLKRTGTRRMHTTALPGGALHGVFQWDAPGNKEIVAVTDTTFGHKTTDFGEFTTITLPVTAGFGPAVFQTFRDTTASGTLVLYFATFSGELYKWDGTTLTRITGTTGAPQAIMIKAYHTRMFRGR